METLWRNALWSQYGAAIDMLEDAVRACPDALWHERLWVVPADDPVPPDIAAVWNVTFHTLFWLDFYLSGTEEGFAPPAPFTLNEFDPAGAMPDRTYTTDELLTYLTYCRDKCRTTITTLTDERARETVVFPWTREHPMSFYELALYNMRHVQEHGAQLHLLLGQHGIHVSSWVARALDETGDH